MKKIVVFGGGTGLSCLLSGLKLFPVDVTTVIAVSDNGSSTGQLKEELNIPAVGDIGKVLLSMANCDEQFVDLLSYRFKADGSLNNHPVRNIILAALIDLKGNLTEASRYMCELLDVHGTVLPLSEERIDLIGEGEDQEYVGEVEVGENAQKIMHLTYDHEIHVNQEVLDRIATADLIIFSPGSLFTSILPHLIAPQVKEALKKTKAPLMYVSNLVTQPGETENFALSDHLNVLNSNLNARKIDYVIANNTDVDDTVESRYFETEKKQVVELDRDKTQEMGAEIIEGNVLRIDENGKIRHDAVRTAFLVFQLMMNKESN